MELFDVGSIGASGSDRRENGVLCHRSRGASQYKASAFQQVSQFQQGVLVISVAVDNHCQGRCVRTVNWLSSLGQNSGSRPAKTGRQKITSSSAPNLR